MSGPRHKYVAARTPPGPELRKMGPRHWAYHRPVGRFGTLGRVLRRLALIVLAVVPLAVLGLVGFKLWVDADTQGLIYADGDASVPQHHVALVFGGFLQHLQYVVSVPQRLIGGKPSPKLLDFGPEFLTPLPCLRCRLLQRFVLPYIGGVAQIVRQPG